MFPAKLRKQLDESITAVVNRDIFEGAVLYPKPEWDKVNAEWRAGAGTAGAPIWRRFMSATHIDPDGSGRINTRRPARAHQQGCQQRDCLRTGWKVEIWNQDAYNKQVIQDEDDLDFGDSEDVKTSQHRRGCTSTTSPSC